MQDDKYTSTIKDAEEGTKLRTVSAQLKDELIRVHLHNDNHDESKERSCLKHCSCDSVHQTAELTYEKHKPLLIHRRLLTSLLSQIDGLQTFSYKSHVSVADCETCCVRDSRRNNRGERII